LNAKICYGISKKLKLLAKYRNKMYCVTSTIDVPERS
jgi:hypothetical protein